MRRDSYGDTHGSFISISEILETPDCPMTGNLLKELGYSILRHTIQPLKLKL